MKVTYSYRVAVKALKGDLSPYYCETIAIEDGPRFDVKIDAWKAGIAKADGRPSMVSLYCNDQKVGWKWFNC